MVLLMRVQQPAGKPASRWLGCCSAVSRTPIRYPIISALTTIISIVHHHRLAPGYLFCSVRSFSPRTSRKKTVKKATAMMLAAGRAGAEDTHNQTTSPTQLTITAGLLFLAIGKEMKKQSRAFRSIQHQPRRARMVDKNDKLSVPLGLSGHGLEDFPDIGESERADSLDSCTWVK